MNFKLSSEYKNSNELKSVVSEFYQQQLDGELTGEDYHNFYKSMARYIVIEKPSFLSNLYFFITYQVNYMYVRYFMWNFVGRQDDVQGNFDVLHGNWLSGINFIDEIRLGNQTKITDDAKNNKARNTYFFSLNSRSNWFFFSYKHDKSIFWILLIFFLFTGLALKVYLNERPFEPRERDYALVGSFYVFAIWIGLGAYNLCLKLKNIGNLSSLMFLQLFTAFISPFFDGISNWDDHDRSNRYTAQAVAKSYLTSIQKDSDAIILQLGIMTLLLFGMLKILRGYRTDVRPINTSLLATDWYIDQMKRKTYESNPIPSQLTHNLYAYGVRDYIKYEPVISDSIRWDIKDFVRWIASDEWKQNIVI